MLGAEHRRAAAAGPGFIAAYWHGRIAFAPLWALPGRRTWAVISANRDGQFIAELAARFGIAAIRGSSADPRKPRKDKGGLAVVVLAARALRAGDCVAIAADGPRGPRMRAQPGIAALSALARAPVAPVAFATRLSPRLGTWDRFVAPLPFDRGVMVYGPPVPPPDATGPEALAAHLSRIEAALTDATDAADRAMGRRPVAPAAPR